MAGSTGIEPATSGLTVQCANQAAPRARLEVSLLYTDSTTLCKAHLHRFLYRSLFPHPGGVHLSCSQRPLYILVRGDRVPLEHRSRLVAAHAHSNVLGNPSPCQVANTRATEIMEEQPRHTRPLTRGLPRLPYVTHRTA